MSLEEELQYSELLIEENEQQKMEVIRLTIIEHL